MDKLEESQSKKSSKMGRPRKDDFSYRLSKLAEGAMQYIEDVMSGKVEVPNATKLTLCWTLLEKYGGVSKKKGKKGGSSFEHEILNGD